jgi:hypothetical protein
MKIAFILPQVLNYIPGGYRVVLDYARQLKNDGFDVSVILPCYPHHRPIPVQGLRQKISAISPIHHIYRLVLSRIRKRQFYQTIIHEWPDLKEVIETPYSLEYYKKFKTCETVISTWWETAWFLNDLNVKAKKIYFCQGYETWGGPENLVKDSYELKDLNLLVVSTWLQNKILKEHARSSQLLLNPVSQHFREPSPQVSDREYDFGLIVRNHQTSKGRYLAERVNREFGHKYKILFATFDGDLGFDLAPLSTVKICRGHQDMLTFYHQTKIHVFTSQSEGFGLPIAESMLSGCLVITTPVGCAQDLIQNGVNGWVLNSFDEDEMLKCIADVLHSPAPVLQGVSDAAKTADVPDLGTQSQTLAHWLKDSH